jgi:hypothetical protein
MYRVSKSSFIFGLLLAGLAGGVASTLRGGQAPPKASGNVPSQASIGRGVDLVSTGHCTEALAILKRGREVADKKVRYPAAMATAQCGMSTDQEDAVVESLL